MKDKEKRAEPHQVDDVTKAVDATPESVSSSSDRCDPLANGEAAASDTPPPLSAAHRPPDPFDPSKLTLGQDFGIASGVKKLVTMVPVRKPNKSEWVMVHDDPAYHLQTAALVYKEDREELFLVDRALWSELAGEIRPIALFATTNRQGILTLWPVKLPGADGRIDSWNASAMDAASRARKQWVRVAANMALGGYELYEATGELSAPKWPDLSMREILSIAFKDNFIRDINHIVLKKLRGEA